MSKKISKKKSSSAKNSRKKSNKKSGKKIMPTPHKKSGVKGSGKKGISGVTLPQYKSSTSGDPRIYPKRANITMTPAQLRDMAKLRGIAFGGLTKSKLIEEINKSANDDE